MKGLRLLFAVFLTPLTVFGAVAGDSVDIARAATARNETTTISANRKKSISQQPQKNTTSSRAVNTVKTHVSSREHANEQSERTRTTSANVIQRTSPQTRGVSNRTTTAQKTRTTQQTSTNTRVHSIGRSTATPTQTNAQTHQQNTRSKTSIRSTINNSRAATISRNADTLRTQILSRDFSKCRDVFYGCMDEFCANKDSQLKRCACSSRINEFDSTKRNLDAVEEKLLDFSQRLLTVNMNAEDVAAMNQATEGELAFNQQDKSQSKKLLDEIAKKLNTSFDDSNFDQSLNAISLSLNADAAFDSVDSMMGASTTTKSGAELYSAALPVCIEMASEVCTADELSIAQSGYQMTIEQDCNTVAKSYKNLTDQARTKVFESGALLDMSRLDIHQQRNSDDILTCKKKMLDMLTDTTVCGDKLGQCLDISGQYIDPTTGAAFLTPNLSNLSTLIHRPDTGQTWTNAPGNDRFVTYLNSKKQFLEPAMENCQDIADSVWTSFVEDALSQIKLAQESKLEDMRRSCTTLLSQCLDNANDSISEFDARALSVFGLASDTTANAMCSNVRESCTVLLDSTGGGLEWSTGVESIATTVTYEKLLHTCREVGRQCIIRTCTAISGNFGLCENINTSINRKSIINRSACWNEVENCVASAGDTALTSIIAQEYPKDIDGNLDYKAIYKNLYNVSAPVHDICNNCYENNAECATCRLTEQIWGNCEHAPSTELNDKTPTNKIYVNYTTNPDNETLLSWFSRNTGTENKDDSCRDTACPMGQQMTPEGICATSDQFTDDGAYCPASDKQIHMSAPVTNDTLETKSITNCCTNGFDGAGFCCADGESTQYRTEEYQYSTGDANTNWMLCLPNSKQLKPFAAYTYKKDDGTTVSGYIICNGTIEEPSKIDTDDDNYPNGKDDKYPNGKTVICDGQWIHIVPKDGGYKTPTTHAFYKNTDNNTCIRNGYKDQNGNWNAQWKKCDGTIDSCPFQTYPMGKKNNKSYYGFVTYKNPCGTTSTVTTDKQ